MVALRGKEIDAFLARPDPSRPIILLYGPDAGLVHERADALMASAVDDPNDPFSLVKMDGDELAAEPSRLVDEAMTVPLFGGRRAIRIRAGSRSFASGIDTLAEMQLSDCRIVIEAGELRPDAPLRKACEKAKSAVAIACYADTERDLAKLIDDELRLSNLKIAPDARAALTSLLGGERQAVRSHFMRMASARLRSMMWRRSSPTRRALRLILSSTAHLPDVRPMSKPRSPRRWPPESIPALSS